MRELIERVHVLQLIHKSTAFFVFFKCIWVATLCLCCDLKIYACVLYSVSLPTYPLGLDSICPPSELRSPNKDFHSSMTGLFLHSKFKKVVSSNSVRPLPRPDHVCTTETYFKTVLTLLNLSLLLQQSGLVQRQILLLHQKLCPKNDRTKDWM